MTKFVMRGGRMVSTERAAILDGLAAGEEPQPIVQTNTPRQESAPARPRSERLAADIASGATLTPQQKRAATMAANKAAKAAAAAEPLRPTNIDPATGETVILKEVKDPVTGEISQVPVEGSAADDAAATEAEADADKPAGEEPDPFDAAVEAAAGAGAAAPADESAAADLDASAVADAG